MFDYDGIYDDIKAQKEKEMHATSSGPSKEPKYIAQLVANARAREKKHELIREKIIDKRNKAEDAIYGKVTEKFVTSAYKRKLMEREAWEKDEECRAKEQDNSAITAKGSMGAFLAAFSTKSRRRGPQGESSRFLLPSQVTS